LEGKLWVLENMDDELALSAIAFRGGMLSLACQDLKIRLLFFTSPWTKTRRLE